MLNFTINEERCIQCGKCVADCPPMCISMAKGEYPSIPEEYKCIGCQHCLAVCPTAALSILGVDPDESMEVKHELPTTHSMETLIKARRSTRKYKQKGLEKEAIKKLLDIAWHAPTGTNAQGVQFTATMNAEVTEEFRKEVYEKIGVLLADKDPEEDDLPLKYLRMSHGAYTEHGIDVVLRGAPHVLVASAPIEAACPKEDTLIALTTFELLAQSSGVGTLWNGILKWCLVDYFPELAAKLGVPEGHMVGYSMVFGTPAVEYHRTVQRGPAALNLVESF